jgi:HAD superfamily hydrolase (TIGR01484 family)
MPLPQQSCIAFDLDGTLAVSKGPITDYMAQLLTKLLGARRVAVISGGKFDQLNEQVAAHLQNAKLENLFLLPTTGTELFVWEHSAWQNKYDESISMSERDRVITCIEHALETVGYHEEVTYGDIIEDRGGQITFSGLGSKAPAALKASWDPDMTKRKRIIEILQPDLSEYTITIGGMTSIDITRAGKDKAYGMQKFSQLLGLDTSDILFVGDKLEPGGNDYSVKAAGIATIAVADPSETEVLIAGWTDN